MTNSNTDVAARQRSMSVLARAQPEALEAHLTAYLATRENDADSNRAADARGRAWPAGVSEIRKAESGLVLVRGRTGGTGDAFNCGEMTMSRCAVQHVSGLRGFGYVAGRQRRHAELAAIFDLLAQLEPALIEASVIAPLEQQWLQTRRNKAAKAASTRVNFMTMVRGED